MITANAFNESRQPGDIDLVNEITFILISVNHPEPTNWTKDPIIIEAMNAAPKLQRFLINRYWRTQLGLCTQSTTRERFCLVDTGSYEEYLTIFKDAVAPSIVKYSAG